MVPAVLSRGEEMFKLLETVTEYTKKYGRPSLSDIAAFERMVGAFEEVKEWYPEEKQINCDIYRAWEMYLEHDQIYNLQYGWENLDEQIDYFLEQKHIITDIEEEDEDADV